MNNRRWIIEDGGLMVGPVRCADRTSQRDDPTRPAGRGSRALPLRLCVSAVMFLFGLLVCQAQSYSIDWDTVGGSGGASSGGLYAVSDTSGQPACGDPLTGSKAAYDDGFWSLFYVVSSVPVAQPMTVYRTAGLTLKIALADVATNWSDADGESVSLAGINLVTTNGINLFTNSSYIFYTNGPDVNDQISYSIAASGGATNTGVINIMVVPSVTGQVTGSITFSGGSATVGFAGIPDYSYSVQRSTNLVDWVTIWTTNAPANGLFSYTDTFGDLGAPPPAAYYRLSWTP